MNIVKKTKLLAFSVLLIIAVALTLATPGPVNPQKKLVADKAKIVKLASGFIFTEGPAANKIGNIFFSDVIGNSIYMWSSKGKISTFRQNSKGTNGMFFDDKGNLIVCEGTTRRIVSIKPDGKINIVADNYQGRRFNRPNDLWLDPKGGIYFTDPAYRRKEHELDLSYEGLYYITPATRKVILLDKFNRPNGLIGTRDGKKLYVAEHRGRRIWSYNIKPDGTLFNKKLFIPVGSDGMTIDEEGNIYVTNLDNNSIDIYSKRGRRVESIKTPERPSNMCFGNKDKKTLFITCSTSLYSIKMNVGGQ